MNLKRKFASSLLVLSLMFSNIVIVHGMDSEIVSVPEGTFTGQEQAETLTDFIGIESNDNGVILDKKDGDHHALLNTDKTYKDFIYEADVLLTDDSDFSAGLIFGVANKDNIANSWMAINFDTTNENVSRLFRVSDGTEDIASIKKEEVSIDFTQTVHLFLDINSSGEFIYTISNNDDNEVKRTGTVNNWQGGYIGLLTFKSSATFSNIQLTDRGASANDLKTNLDGIKENDNWTYSKTGIIGDSKGNNDAFLLSESSGGNFVYEADVKFNERQGAASLVFRADDDLEHKYMYVANLNGETGEARLFKFENNEAVDLAKSQKIQLNDNNEYHLKVTVIDKHMVYYINGQLIINTADYTMNSSNDDSHYGQNDVIDSGYFGLLTWNGNVTYQNINYTSITDKNSPQLTGLSVSSIGGKVDKQIQFSKGQYVYITYVTNATTAVSLNPEISNDSEIIATNEDSEVVDINHLPVTDDLQTYTLTVRNGQAKVVYRVRVHRMQPDESYYNEEYRGQYHYSVKDGWANDPNGMVYFNGKYHLFYQYYDSDIWGPMHWAHATSEDLITWEEQPIEFYPDEYGTMYSGCAVIADHTTAPAIFAEGEEGIVFFITANGTNGSDGQRVIAAYSKDGQTFQKYDDGKVILDWKDDPLKSTAFRDPKVFRYENKWFMVIAGGPLRIYSSNNLVDWKVESTYADLHTECPDLYPLTVKDANGNETGEVKWVLDRGGRKYKIGDFKEVNGKWCFVPDGQYASTNAGGMGNEDNDGIMNFGMDSYAAMTYYQGDFGTASNFKSQDIIAINWMNTWEAGFCNAIPAANENSVFNGTFNLQCELGIQKDSKGNYYLTQTPIDEYKTLRDEDNKVELKDITIDGKTNSLSNFNGDSYEIVAHILPDSNTTKVGFKVRVSDDEETLVYYDLENNTITLDRRQSGILVVNQDYINVNSQKVSRNEDGSIDLDIYVDRSSIEVFTKDYTVAGAMQIFPNPSSQGVEIYSEGGKATADIIIYPMNSIWSKETPTKALNIGLNKTSWVGYVGDKTTISAWLTPVGVEQDIEYSVDNEDVVSLTKNGNQVQLEAKKAGSVTITAYSKSQPDIKKTCTITVYENNFKTNLTNFEATAGNWYVDDEIYYGSYNDNGFLFANKIDSSKYTYEIDAKYESGIINFIFNSQTPNVWDGCYAVQLKEDNEVRLFDFKGDETLALGTLTSKPEDNQYHIEIIVDNQTIKVIINDEECITKTLEDSAHIYNNGYVGLGLYNASAQYQNFYVTTDSPAEKIVTTIDDLNPIINCTLEDIQKLLPEQVQVAGEDGIVKKDLVDIEWNYDNVDVNNPGTYTITGNTKDNLEVKVQVTIRSNRALEFLTKNTVNSNDYTEESYEAYLTALDNAKSVLENSNASQAEIDEAFEKLYTAIENLKKVDLKDPNKDDDASDNQENPSDQTPADKDDDASDNQENPSDQTPADKNDDASDNQENPSDQTPADRNDDASDNQENPSDQTVVDKGDDTNNDQDNTKDIENKSSLEKKNSSDINTGDYTEISLFIGLLVFSLLGIILSKKIINKKRS